MLDPKHLLQGNPLANWKRIVFPILDRASQMIVACWVVIVAGGSLFLTYLVLRMLWVLIKLLESTIGGAS